MSLSQRMDKKIWYIYTVEYYSAVKNNDIMKLPVKLIELEKKIILSEITQDSERQTWCILAVAISCEVRGKVIM